jgi:phosphate:Na+ symporter
MDMKEIKANTILMADKVLEILELIDRGFMENKAEFLTKAMNLEHEINENEKAMTREILGLSKSAKDKRGLVVMAQMVETFERMGDEAANLVERIEIKIAEKLLFSEIGVDQFNETYRTMKKSVEMMREFLKGPTNALRERVIDNGFHVKELVERYRKEHAERLVRGECTELGVNMYFDMLDFTGNLARHASNVVKLF